MAYFKELEMNNILILIVFIKQGNHKGFFFQVKFKSSFKFNIVRQKDPQMEFRYD